MLFYSCITHKSIPTKSVKLSNLITEKTWNDSITKIKPRLKALWSEFYNPAHQPDFLKKMKYNLPDDTITNNQMEILPIQTYILDSTALSKISKDADVLSLLTPSTFLLYGFVFNKTNIHFFTETQITNNKLRICTNGPVFKDYADTVSNLIFKKKIQLLHVYLEYRISVKNEGRPFNIFVENNDVYSLQMGGLKRKFVDELLEIKEAIRKGERW